LGLPGELLRRSIHRSQPRWDNFPLRKKASIYIGRSISLTIQTRMHAGELILFEWWSTCPENPSAAIPLLPPMKFG
jgi:hypothetical protein